METTHTPWYLKADGTLDADKILDTTPPVDRVIERYKQRMHDSLHAFCIVEDKYSLEREKAFSAVYSAFYSLIETCGEQCFIDNVCCWVLAYMPEKECNLNGLAARHLAQVSKDAYSERQAELQAVSDLAEQGVTLLERQFGEPMGELWDGEKWIKSPLVPFGYHQLSVDHLPEPNAEAYGED